MTSLSAFVLQTLTVPFDYRLLTMRFVKFFVALAVAVGFCWAMHHPLPVGSGIPALGKLLNPFTGFWQNADALDAIPDLELPGLTGTVQVAYDDRRVPHVFAENDLDLARAQGYLTARDRYWQMDFSTRAASGRLSEVLDSPAVLEYDKLQRRKGMVYAAENALEKYKEDTEFYPILEAYTEGVNAYVAQLTPVEYPLEMKLIGYEPEPWSVLKTVFFIKSMAQTLASGYEDVEATNTRELLGDALFAALYPSVPAEEEPVIPVETEYDFEPMRYGNDTLTQWRGTTPERHDDKPDPHYGSNNWAVSGTKTASGNPILCSDPHLKLRLPAIWYEMQLSTPEFNAYGVSLPGIPGLAIGFNDSIAWGVTNVGHDVSDWYRIQWKDASRMQYLLDGEFRDVILKVESYTLKDGSTVHDTVRYTHHGPIVYDSADDGSGYGDLALHWLVHEKPMGNEIKAFHEINRAKNYADFRMALMGYDAPAQNFCFASTDGTVALVVNGRFPYRRDENEGRFVADGSTTASDWLGYIPADQNPAVVNPERGFVSSANQRSTSTTYPYAYLSENFEQYRNRTLNRKLRNMSNITVEDMMRLQNNNESLKAAEVLPRMLELTVKSDLSKNELVLLNQLQGWDYQYLSDRVEPVVFDLWFEQLYKVAYDELYSVADSLDVLYPSEVRTTELLRNQPTHPIWDDRSTPEREAASDVVTTAYRKAYQRYRELDDDTESAYTLSDKRDFTVQHMARIAPFSRPNLPIDGDGDALNANSSSWAGPSWRMVVELEGGNMKGWGVYPGGASGNPGSRYYDSMVDTWAAGEYYELLRLPSAATEHERVEFMTTLNP